MEYVSLDRLTREQADVCCDDKNNCLLIACPGSGKTRTIVHRLAYMTEKHPDSLKINAAITYTNKAAEEIEARLQKMNIPMKSIWVGTIHQFCITFIMKPYCMYDEELSYGFQVVNSDADKKDLGDIDFDDILCITKRMLENHKFIRENVSHLFRTVLVDEYQDTRKKQYEILAELAKSNKRIQFLFAGDPNQSIYTGIGSFTLGIREIEKLFCESFILKRLTGCFRSTQRVIDYYQFFAVNPSTIQSKTQDAEFHGQIVYDFKVSRQDLPQKIANIICRELEAGVPPEEICVAAPQWNMLYKMLVVFRDLLPDIDIDAPEIAPFPYNRNNPFYWIAWLIFSPRKGRSLVRRRIAGRCLCLLKDLYDFELRTDFDETELLYNINHISRLSNADTGIELYDEICKKLVKIMAANSSLTQNFLKEYKKYIQQIKQRVLQNKIGNSIENFKQYYRIKKGIVISTIYGLKGLEFTTVIGFGLLNGKVPHWDTIRKYSREYSENESRRLLYVLLSRAKKNIYLFSETGEKTKGGKEYQATPALRAMNYLYD